MCKCDSFTDKLIQSESREMRGFEGQAAVFCNDQLIGATESLLNWAACKYYYHDDQWVHHHNIMLEFVFM